MRMKLLAAGSVLGLALAMPVMASPVNLVTNGSFEAGLTGWNPNVAQAAGGFPAAAITLGVAANYPVGAFGEAVPANNAATNSPDPVGTRAAYFVDDFSTNETLSQTIFLNPGIYQIGFSAYLPQNGANNAGEATFFGSILGVPLANFVASAEPAVTWMTFAGSTNILVAGNYLVEFIFNTSSFPSKDVVIDQVYVIVGNPPIGVPVPAALGLFGLGLLGLAAARRGTPALG